MSRNGPLHQSRAAQIADYLRDKLRSGYWREHLPPERELVQQLGVSRWSLRAALAELQREGFVTERTRAGTRLPQRRPRRSVEPPSVGLVFSSRTGQIVGKTRILLDEMTDFFESRKVRLEVHKVPYLKGKRVSALFDKLFHEVTHDCWALVAPTLGMQEWCRRRGVPAIVIGVADEASAMPGVGVDYHALCRHAAGEMLRRGHRRLALVLARDEKGEDVQSRLGFEEGVAGSPHPDASFTFEIHDQTIQGVCKLADRLLAARPRPTAWLVCRQGHFITALTHLLRRKIDVPGEISVVCRDSDIYIDDIVPAPTRYVYDMVTRARQSARLALRIIAGQSLPKEGGWMIPEFIEGETLGPAPTVEQ